MELWIRSQDKEILTKIDSIHYYYDEDNNTHNIDGVYYILGTYKTKERALEILDEIQRFIYSQGKSYVELNEKGIPKEIKQFGYIYEMPQE